MNKAYIEKDLPNTNGGLIILVLFLFPLRLKDPKQLQ